VPTAVAKAAMDSGVAGKPIIDFEGYKARLSARLDPIAGTLQGIFEKARRAPKRVVFAEGEEPQVIRAAYTFASAGLGTPVLVGDEEEIRRTMKGLGLEPREDVEVMSLREIPRNQDYTDYLYGRLQRKGYLWRDCQRLIKNDRNHYAACMVATGDADGMVTGVTRPYAVVLKDIRKVIDPKPGHRVIGVSVVIARGRTVLVADTAVHDMPSAAELAEISVEAAGVARRLGYEPRIAMLAYSTFGYPEGERSDHVRHAVEILDKRHVDFEYDGEMGADVALNMEAMAAYPFCRLSGPANVLVMPAFHSASICTNMLKELGGSTVIGPLLVGLDKAVQIVPLGAKDSDIVNMAAIAAYNISG
jgi:malate dehydrogenase (oxaloacetate-decarboxylating)(NADP+)